MRNCYYGDQIPYKQAKRFDFITIIASVIFGIILLFLSADYGMSKKEKAECNIWFKASQQSEINFLQWQKDQCKNYGIILEKQKQVKKEAKEILVATVYSYNSEIGQTDERPFEMASGKQVYNGALACPSKYDFGTQIEINGKIYTCEDRMAKRYRNGNYFDVWTPDKQSAIEWGKQILTVKIF